MLPALEDPDPDPGGRRVRGRRIQLANPNRYSEAGAKRVRPWLERLVNGIVPDPSTTLAVRFVSDREMRRLNRDYRDRDATTDVLSFPGGETPEGPHLGDIAISVPAARRQARRRNHSVSRELRVLMLHGLLHCMGYDHETDDGEMLRFERRMRRRWIAAR